MDSGGDRLKKGGKKYTLQGQICISWSICDRYQRSHTQMLQPVGMLTLSMFPFKLCNTVLITEYKFTEIHCQELTATCNVYLSRYIGVGMYRWKYNDCGYASIVTWFQFYSFLALNVLLQHISMLFIVKYEMYLFLSCLYNQSQNISL